MNGEYIFDSRKWFLIELLSCLGKIKGITKLQKVVFLGQEELELPKLFQFDEYHYGPYSWDLSDILEDMIITGFVSEKTEYHDDGVIYTYSLANNALEDAGKIGVYIPESKKHMLIKYSKLPMFAISEFVYQKFVHEGVAS